MHLQIRKKEKYLLFSMVCYLLVVSSALFLMVFPVSAEYTLIFEHTTSGTSGWPAPNVLYASQGGTFANLSWGSFTGSLRRTNASMPVSDSVPVTFRSSACAGSIKGNGTYSYMVNGATVNTYYAGSTIDVIFTDKTNSWNVGEQLLYMCVGSISLQNYFALGTYKQSSGQNTSMNAFELDETSNSFFVAGNYKTYSGSATPDIPVINTVTSFPSCLEPGTGVVLESNVTGTVDDWTWEIYDQNDVSVFTGSSPIEQMVDLNLLGPGDYNVQLTVENSGGSDFWQQDDFLHINQSGTCNFTVYDPFPTVNVTPTIQVYPTLTLPSIIDTNMTGINTEIDELWIIGNMSEGYREMVDYYGEGVNTTFTGLVGIIVSPFTFIANAVSTGSSLFSTSYASLMSYTTIPLAIVGITLSYYPWQIITLITAGIAIDAVFVLIFGVR